VKPDRSALIALAATALIWSSGGLAIKLVDAPALYIAGIRSGLACLTLLALARGRLGLTFSRAQVLGGLAYALMLVTNVAATRLTTAANAILLAYTAPLWVALAAPRLLGEPTRPGDWGFVAAVCGGMVLFFLDRLSAGGLWGNVLACGTGLAYAGFTLAMRAEKDASPLATAFLGHALAALLCLPWIAGAALPGPGSLAGLFYLGVVQQGLSLALYAWAIRRARALTAILVMTLEPVLNPLWVALGLGEIPGPWALAGGAVVLLAVTWRGLGSTRSA